VADSFHDHFSSFAGRYADFRPSYPAELFDYLASLTPKHELAWDCAAGNGQATVGLAGHFSRVVATDASREQIASAKPHPKIDYRVAPADNSGLPNQSVSVVTVAQALHWFNLDAFYAEAERVLEPGGVLAVWAYGINRVEGEAVDRLVQDLYSNTVGPYWPPERTLVESGYRSLALPFPELPAPVMRMEARWTLEQLLGYFSTWSATNRCIKATGKNPLEPLSLALAEVWGDAALPRLVSWPLALRVGRKA
jgi:SAM-dependent methyltransferase